MTEVTMTRLHEWMLVLYAISLVFYFIDVFNKDKFAHRSAFILLVLVGTMQTTLIVATYLQKRQFPILSFFDGIYYYAWLLILLGIALHIINKKVGYASFFINVLGFLFLSIHTFAPAQIKGSAVGESLLSELVFIHIVFAIISYAAFTMSFVFGVLYLLLYTILKGRKWSKHSSRLPSLHQTFTGMRMSIAIGIPFLTISLLLGTQWAYIIFDEFHIVDMKIVGSFLLIIIYSYLLYALQSGKWGGSNGAWAMIFAYLAVLINFFLGSTLSNFHLWM